MTHPFPFQNSYARLPDRFFARVAPTPVEAPRLIAVNAPLANRLGIDAEWLRSPEGVEVLSGRRVPGGAEPIATAYAGHQFGQFVPQLGDGRAVLLGEVVAPDGGRFDVQLKGAGPTPFSRRGDGRAALGPVLREYVLCEAMHALGIPTTRALAAVATGEWVFREEPLPGAVLTRVAASHLRVGTFQFFAARHDGEALRLLADHVIDRHYPEAAEADNRYLALLRGVTAAQADLVARWMLVGFIHGVMNTDNMSLAGETIDYGPCAFMDAYHPGKVFSSIDTGGRYAFANQPDIALWNLTRLAETLLPLLGMEQEAAVAAATEELKAFAGLFNARFHQGLRTKLGLTTAEEGDAALAFDLLDAMADNLADFTRTFRGLSAVMRDGDNRVRDEFANPQAFDAWAGRWRERLLREPERAPEARADAMDAVNPAFIPRNHRVEAMIEAAVERGDFGPFRELMTVLARPFDEQPAFSAYADAPAEGEQVTQTFCGT